jgi:signal transduction histidine kinase
MEKSLQMQKKFTEKLIENSAAATFVLDSHHKVILWNRACEALTGIPASDMIGTSNHWCAFYDHERPCLSDIVLDAGTEGLEGLYDNYAKSTLVANGLHAEGWYKNLNGRDRYIMFDAAPIYDDNGNLLAAIETLNDLTRQKRADEALLESHDRLTVILDSINALIYVTDMDTNEILFVNKYGRDIWGDIAGKICWETLQEGQSGPCPFCTNDRLLNADGTPAGVYAWEFRNSLSGRWYDCRDQAIRWNDGRLVRMEIATDISLRRNLEAQLHHAQKMESIGTLAGGIAHDFNNILSAIIGYGQFTLMKMMPDDPMRHNIDSMLEAADRAAHLTQELLLFSRKQPIDKKAVDLNLVVARVEKFLKKVIREDITSQIALHDSELPVIADAYQLEQVLMNLATNARDSMPLGGKLTISTGIVTLNGEFVSVHGFGRPGEFALITVADTGTGMDADTQQKIFEPFFTTKEVGKGTGLGLAVAYGIIEQHDGYITVQSDHGKGTTFSIYLPIINTQINEESLAGQEVSAIGGTETILLAEDDEAVRVMTKKLLTEFGYTVIDAVDGTDAVGRFAANSQRIDLLLFDLIMPNMNGKEAFDEIREIRTDIKVLFCSGYAPETVRQKVLLAEGIHLIAKPVFPLELLRKVRSVLDGDLVN